MQTFITKLLGPINTWSDKINFDKNLNYNSFHFTPMCEIGYSNSAYSIKNFLEVDQRYRNDANDTPLNWDQIQKFIKENLQNSGNLAFMDLVWNHASFDNKFLVEHPEGTYNLENCPHLVRGYITGCFFRWRS